MSKYVEYFFQIIFWNHFMISNSIKNWQFLSYFGMIQRICHYDWITVQPTMLWICNTYYCQITLLISILTIDFTKIKSKEADVQKFWLQKKWKSKWIILEVFEKISQISWNNILSGIMEITCDIYHFETTNSESVKIKYNLDLIL